ncbi:hypothetical protein Tco_0565539 [Tanacetum coccineum]
MSSDSASSEVTYTSISSHGDPLAWAVDFFRLQEPDSPEAAPASPDYVPGPEEPEQAPLSPDYVPGPEYPEYLAPSDEEVPVEDQPYVVADSPIALSLGYVADSDPEEDPEDMEEEAKEEEEEEHLAPADSVVAPVVDHVPSSEETKPFETDESAATPPSPPACRTTARISIRPEAPMPFPSEEEVERLLALPPPPPSPLISQTPPLQRTAYKIESLITIHSSSTTSITTITTSTIITTFTTTCTHIITITIITTTTTPASLFIPPLVDHREDTPKAELPPCKRLYLTALTSSSGAGHTGCLCCDRGNQDKTDLVVFEKSRTVEDGQFHYETARLLDQEALVSREAWAHSVGLSLAVYYELQAYRTHTQMLDFRIASQESLVTTLIAHVSSLQGQLSAALGQIQALQARGQTHADDHEGTGSFA